MQALKRPNSARKLDSTPTMESNIINSANSPLKKNMSPNKAGRNLKVKLFQIAQGGNSFIKTSTKFNSFQ
jgi:hypothetical protein